MKLTDQQVKEVKKELVGMGKAKPVRFLFNGQALNIITGELCSKGSNVMYHPVYWNFTKATTKKIKEWLGVKTVWSE